VHKVLIAADNDEPGTTAAHKAADSYRARGYQVQIVSPLASGADFNDLVMRRVANGRRS
jgi:DNA primase